MGIFGWTNKRDVREQATEYATRRDFQRIFTEEMAGLHLLAFLLTADPAKAEQCFVAGLEDSIRGNTVFKHWARSWSKRAIIKNAIKAVSFTPDKAEGSTEDGRTSPQQHGMPARIGNAWATVLDSYGPEARAMVAAITSLEPVSRFVLVMAVFEGYSVPECSALLGRSTKEVAAAKSQALERLGSLPASAPPAASGGPVASWAPFLAPHEIS